MSANETTVTRRVACPKNKIRSLNRSLRIFYSKNV